MISYLGSIIINVTADMFRAAAAASNVPKLVIHFITRRINLRNLTAVFIVRCFTVETRKPESNKLKYIKF